MTYNLHMCDLQFAYQPTWLHTVHTHTRAASVNSVTHMQTLGGVTNSTGCTTQGYRTGIYTTGQQDRTGGQDRDNLTTQGLGYLATCDTLDI